MMFLVSEVHPFADGNGRVAQIMMNAELVATAESRIIVPTVFRNNYLAALKALSQNRITGAIIRTLDFAQRIPPQWTLRIWTGRGWFSIGRMPLSIRMRRTPLEFD